MAKPFATGLVVGKFAPLHRGHQLLLDCAAQQCQRLIVLSYCQPELRGCNSERRARWLAALYPQATRLVLDDASLAAWCAQHRQPIRRLPHDAETDAVHRHFVAWVLHDMLDTRVDAVFTSEAYGEGFAAVLSQCQGQAVTHVEVDRARAQVPVSGTQVRRDPQAWRLYLAPVVYADFVQRVALLGGESSGKTTLAERLSHSLQTAWVPEYGRELWRRKQGALIFEDMLHIAQTQVRHEQAAAVHANRLLLCDTTPLTTLFYSYALFGRVDPALQALAERDYASVFLCAPDFPFVQDGTRQTHAFRQRQHAWYLRELGERGIAFTVLQGSPEQRVRTVAQQLQRLVQEPTALA